MFLQFLSTAPLYSCYSLQRLGWQIVTENMRSTIFQVRPNSLGRKRRSSTPQCRATIRTCSASKNPPRNFLTSDAARAVSVDGRLRHMALRYRNKFVLTAFPDVSSRVARGAANHPLRIKSITLCQIEKSFIWAAPPRFARRRGIPRLDLVKDGCNYRSHRMRYKKSQR